MKKSWTKPGQLEYAPRSNILGLRRCCHRKYWGTQNSSSIGMPGIASTAYMSGQRLRFRRLQTTVRRGHPDQRRATLACFAPHLDPRYDASGNSQDYSILAEHPLHANVTNARPRIRTSRPAEPMATSKGKSPSTGESGLTALRMRLDLVRRINEMSTYRYPDKQCDNCKAVGKIASCDELPTPLSDFRERIRDSLRKPQEFRRAVDDMYNEQLLHADMPPPLPMPRSSKIGGRGVISRPTDDDDTLFVDMATEKMFDKIYKGRSVAVTALSELEVTPRVPETKSNSKSDPPFDDVLKSFCESPKVTSTPKVNIVIREKNGPRTKKSISNNEEMMSGSFIPILDSDIFEYVGSPFQEFDGAGISQLKLESDEDIFTADEINSRPAGAKAEGNLATERLCKTSSASSIDYISADSECSPTNQTVTDARKYSSKVAENHITDEMRNADESQVGSLSLTLGASNFLTKKISLKAKEQYNPSENELRVNDSRIDNSVSRSGVVDEILNGSASASPRQVSSITSLEYFSAGSLMSLTESIRKKTSDKSDPDQSTERNSNDYIASEYLKEKDIENIYSSIKEDKRRIDHSKYDGNAGSIRLKHQNKRDSDLNKEMGKSENKNSKKKNQIMSNDSKQGWKRGSNGSKQEGKRGSKGSKQEGKRGSNGSKQEGKRGSNGSKQEGKRGSNGLKQEDKRRSNGSTQEGKHGSNSSKQEDTHEINDSKLEDKRGSNGSTQEGKRGSNGSKQEGKRGSNGLTQEGKRGSNGSKQEWKRGSNGSTQEGKRGSNGSKQEGKRGSNGSTQEVKRGSNGSTQEGKRGSNGSKQEGKRGGNGSKQEGKRGSNGSTQEGKRGSNGSKQEGKRGSNGSTQEGKRGRNGSKQEGKRGSNGSTQEVKRGSNGSTQEGKRGSNGSKQEGKRGGNGSKQEGKRGSNGSKQEGKRGSNGSKQEGKRGSNGSKQEGKRGSNGSKQEGKRGSNGSKQEDKRGSDSYKNGGKRESNSSKQNDKRGSNDSKPENKRRSNGSNPREKNRSIILKNAQKRLSISYKQKDKYGNDSLKLGSNKLKDGRKQMGINLQHGEKRQNIIIKHDRLKNQDKYNSKVEKTNQNNSKLSHPSLTANEIDNTRIPISTLVERPSYLKRSETSLTTVTPLNSSTPQLMKANQIKETSDYKSKTTIKKSSIPKFQKKYPTNNNV